MEDVRIVVKPHWGTYVVVSILALIASVDMLSTEGDFSSVEWAVLLSILVIVLFAIFVFPNTRITFDEYGVKHELSVGVGPVELWEREARVITWPSVVEVYQVTRFPFKALVIEGESDRDENEIVRIGLSSLYVNAKEAFNFLKEKVGCGVFEGRVKF